MDEAEPSPLPGQPEPPQPPARGERPRTDQDPPSRKEARGDPWHELEASGRLDHPVVAGYDGSPSSRHALAYAAGMARRLGRPLLVAHVSPPGVYCEPLTGQVVGALRDGTETERWLLAELDEVCDAADLEVRVITRRGNPARELAATADESGADALVIGAPGHRWHHVAGSVPGWLARHAHCPVIVVP